MTKTLLEELIEQYIYRVNSGEVLSIRSVLKDIRDNLPRHAEPKEDSLEAWENEAEAFYNATGYLRPGKDPGIIGDVGYCERRDRAWNIWCAGWSYCSEHHHPTPDKAVEPLAVDIDKEPFKGWIKEMPLPLEVLASMKGCSIQIWPPYMSDHGGFQFRLSFSRYDKDFSGELDIAKAAARAYLNCLKNKENI